MYETTAYTVLVPHGLVGKFYPDGGSRYAVAVASVAACSDDCDKEEVVEIVVTMIWMTLPS